MVVVCALRVLVLDAEAAEPCSIPLGHLVSVQGLVEIARAGATDWRPAVPDQPLCAGDAVRVGERSRAEAALLNQPKFRIDQNTSLRLLDRPTPRPILIELITGAAYFFSRHPRTLDVDTPFVSAAVEGTEFLIEVTPDRSSIITVYEGKIVASNDQGRVTILGGQSAVAEAGRPPTPIVLVHPWDAVQWALYFPPILSPLFASGEGRPTGAPEAPGPIADVFRPGDTTEAFARLDRLLAADANSKLYLLRAALLLAVGRADEAEEDIERALALDPNDAIAFGLRAVIAVARNDADEAVDLGRRAVQLDPRSAAARIALSYALQATFELAAARDELLRAVEEEPGNALAWARLAELWLALGERRQARRAADTAERLMPDLARVQVVLGFAALAEVDLARARNAFERAIAIDAADPLAWFGRGLVRVRQGDLATGRGDIEIAIILDPGNALFRSYLGMAFFAERRPKVARDEFARATTLDPKDPTPFLYDGILLQSENQPVEALGQIERAIALNDNRAIYRSRLLLNSDRAGQGASLARIYQDLGFQRLATNTAARSLALDPANASAHRFLADIDATLPRQEISRVSELLQAQLLQDININPVQPSFGATNLNIINTGGPARPGLNEYTAVFARNQVKLHSNVEGGSNNTFSGETIVSSVYNALSISAGQFYYQTDGFRRNANLEHQVYDIFAQDMLSPDVNVQAEFQSIATKQGDIFLNGDPEIYDPDLSERSRQYNGRVGVRVSPSPSEDVLASFIVSDLKQEVSDTRLPARGYQAETAYLKRGPTWNLTSGFAAYFLSQDLQASYVPGNPDINARQYAGYVHGNFRFPDSFLWSFGGTYNDYRQGNLHLSNISPNAGVQWDITQEITVRVAAFRSLKPALANNRTIQPTQIAGFSQFFDDPDGTESWTYNLGADVRPTPSAFAGVALTHRAMRVPIYRVTRDQFVRDTVNETNARAYGYWTPAPRWSVATELIHDTYRDESGTRTDAPKRVETLSAPISLRFFHPSGFFGTLTTTLVDQDVSGASGNASSAGEDRFVLLDASLGYRFPARRGQISLAVINLLNKGFKFQDDNYRTFDNLSSVGRFTPERTVTAQLSLDF